MKNMMSTPLSAVEKIKKESHGLRGNIVAQVANPITGSVPEDTLQLVKFHGMYLQDDRDRREERAAKKLERLYSFMIRLRLPGGQLTPLQWVAAQHIAGEHSTGNIKITTRQTIQLHGVLKSHLKPTLQAFDAAALDSIATCGDVNRNVAAASHPLQSPLHDEIHAYASKISALLMPKTRSYYEIWLDEEKIAERSEEEPLYEDRYLPRKFKIGIGIPPNNEVDVFANDIGLIAIVEDGQLKGFNIAIGGGLSQTHGNAATYPRLATVIGFTAGEDNTLKAVYEILTLQRDYGNRSDRKLARLKYTVDQYGIAWWKKEIENRTGFALEPARPFHFKDRQDYFGWHQTSNGHWYYTAFIEHGRVVDDANAATKTALLEIAKTEKAQFRFTSNQNIILADVLDSDKAAVDHLLQKFGLAQFTENASALRKNSMACVAFNTCPLALAEAQRYLPTLITKLDQLCAKHQLQDLPAIIRMTGCPNGCGRSPAAEIGFIGTAYGEYNLYLGGDRAGTRLNSLFKARLSEPEILQILDELLAKYAAERQPEESFGDFAHRMILNPPIEK